MNQAIDPILTPDYQASPETVLARLRKEDPVHWIPMVEGWAITRYDLVRRLFDHPSISSDRRYFEKYVPPASEIRRKMYEHIPLEQWAERHSFERRMVAAGLSRDAVKGMDGLIREIVERFAKPLRGRRGVVELASEFTDVVPNSVISRITGIAANEGEEAEFLEMSRHALGEMNPTEDPEEAKRMEASFEALIAYVKEIANRRRKDPRDDLISHLLKGHTLSDEEADDLIVLWVSNLVRAGTATVALAQKFGLRAMSRFPDQWKALRADRSLIPNAVNEMLRYDFGDGMLPKYVKEDFELEGKQLKKGQLVLLSFMGAHRDPAVWGQDADRLDIHRDSSAQLIFGFGHTSCLGAHLARKELHIIFEALLDVLPENLRVLEDQIKWSNLGPFHHMDTLPVDFGS